jgi:16S rRNA (guanine966-N2)-methyltransferase
MLPVAQRSRFSGPSWGSFRLRYAEEAMRIIAGMFRSRPLQAPAGLSTRPTSDRLRETLFNVLAPRIEGARFLDLYAGSGAVGLEALSRGAARVTCVERAASARETLSVNLRKLGAEETVCVRSGSVAEYLKQASGPWDVVFLDPPYDAEAQYTATLGALGGASASLLAVDAVVIAEHRRKEKLEDRYGKLTRSRLLEQGDAALSFYQSVGSSATE